MLKQHLFLSILLAVLVVPFAIAASGAIYWASLTEGEFNSSPTVVNNADIHFFIHMK